MIKNINRIALVLLSAAMLFGLSACGKTEVEPEKDPHEGQVYIYDGFDWVWMTPLEGVPVSEFSKDNFVYRGTTPTYTGHNYTTLTGVDVSEHQHEVDWKAVKASGMDYAYVRLGYRGCTEGGLFEDPFYKANVTGAAESGLMVGVYFFSQAISVEEAVEEANFVLERLAAYDVSLPVIFDWEKIESSDGEAARTDNMNFAVLTDAAEAFCETISAAGYKAGIYFNRHIGYYGINLQRFTDYTFWFALPEMVYPSFYYAIDMWQYSFTESVPGIEGETDVNLMFIPVISETTSAQPAQ